MNSTYVHLQRKGRFMTSIMPQIQEYLQNLELFQQILIILLISMIPVIELRGALPVAMLAGVPWYIALPVAIMGNMLPTPFILLFVRKIFKWLRAHTRLGSLVDRIENRGKRNIEKVQKYEILGLAVFVAIPLPGTGAWTGALIGALMDMPLKKALPTLAAGVLGAGIIVTVLFYYFPKLLGL